MSKCWTCIKWVVCYYVLYLPFVITCGYIWKYSFCLYCGLPKNDLSVGMHVLQSTHLLCFSPSVVAKSVTTRQWSWCDWAVFSSPPIFHSGKAAMLLSTLLSTFALWIKSHQVAVFSFKTLPKFVFDALTGNVTKKFWVVLPALTC